jgi:hypothetical protein
MRIEPQSEHVPVLKFNTAPEILFEFL